MGWVLFHRPAFMTNSRDPTPASERLVRQGRRLISGRTTTLLEQSQEVEHREDEEQQQYLVQSRGRSLVIAFGCVQTLPRAHDNLCKVFALFTQWCKVRTNRCYHRRRTFRNDSFQLNAPLDDCSNSILLQPRAVISLKKLLITIPVWISETYIRNFLENFLAKILGKFTSIQNFEA